MRTIQKHEPDPMVTWRLGHTGPTRLDYDALKRDTVSVNGEIKRIYDVVITALLKEQGWLCAYTGRPLNVGNVHIEHMTPQTRCRPGQDAEGQDADYQNLVGCYPEPNRKQKEPYGAHKKDSWPSQAEDDLFVRPTSNGVEARFLFDRRGRISPRAGDTAAAATITALGLDHDELTELRKKAIEGLTNPKKGVYLSKPQAQKVLQRLEAQTGRLTPYVFAVKQGLAHYIRKLP